MFNTDILIPNLFCVFLSDFYFVCGNGTVKSFSNEVFDTIKSNRNTPGKTIRIGVIVLYFCIRILNSHSS